MQTANFISASAEITTITSLKKGDVYKRLEETSYSGDSIIHGVVLDVLYNGSDAAIQTMEFTGGYRSMETKFMTFSGSKEIKIFPSTADEVKQYLANTVKTLEEKVEDKKKEVLEAEDALAKANEIMSGSLIKKLRTPEYSSGKTENLVLQPSNAPEDDTPIDISDIPF